MEVSGAAAVRGSLGAECAKVNGKLDVEGALKVTGRLEVLGSLGVEKGVECGTLAAGGRVSADRVVAAGRAELGGQLRTSRGLRAREVLVNTGSKVDGPIAGDAVEVGAGAVSSAWAALSSLPSMGRMTRVDDVYGKDVRIARYSRAKKIYAETVRMQAGSMADEVIYTKEAYISEGVHLEKPARKVDRLPDSPI